MSAPSFANYEQIFLTLDTTLINSYGGHGSNVYCSLQEAAAFFTQSMIDMSAWTSISTLQQMSAILEATRQIDSFQWIGHRFFVWQTLQFPRTTRPIFPWNSSIPPSVFNYEQERQAMDVKRANCIQALYLVRMNGRNIHLERRQQGVTAASQSVGPVHEYFRYNNATPQNVVLSTDTLACLSSWAMNRRILRG